jgi:SAM-dependent methyltransferase
VLESSSHWNKLHATPRFRPIYPSEHVVRFLLATREQMNQERPPRFLDVGAGAGRHLVLARELGFVPVGTDISDVGLTHARERLGDDNTPRLLALAGMTNLPFADQSFEAILSYGVFCYAFPQEMRASISELWRALVAGGRAFVVLRTTDDYRFGKGQELARNTFRLDIADTNEHGCIQHFLSSTDIPEYFSRFAHVSFEKTETTFGNRAGVNSDWLITAEK